MEFQVYERDDLMVEDLVKWWQLLTNSLTTKQKVIK